MRFRARLETQTPLPSGADAEQLRERVQEYLREAERRDPSKSEELVSTVLDHVARDLFRHHAQKKRPRTL
jgi:chorismate mutase